MTHMDWNNIDWTSPQMLIAAAVVLLLIIGAIALAVYQHKKKSQRLRSRFGPEYDLALRETGSAKLAEEALRARLDRVDGLALRELSQPERERYLTEWQMIQARFIDHPRGAVTEADELVNAILLERGYPAGSFAQRAADLSVHHAALVGPYRLANAVTVRAGKNEATTEELRGSMIQYRALIDSLLGTRTSVEPPAPAVTQKRALA